MKAFSSAHPSKSPGKRLTNLLSVSYNRNDWHPSCTCNGAALVVFVSLGRLQSGFLLFETPQGLVRVELSFWQRAYLLWTFRNFRRLSVALLNPRQRALVKALYRNRAGTVSHSIDPLLVIGVVEKFIPPKLQPPAAPAQQGEGPAKVVTSSAERASTPSLVPSSSRGVAWPRSAATLAVLSLCVISVVAWHRIQGVPGSHAQNQPHLQQVTTTTTTAAPTSSRVEKPAAMADRSAAIAPLPTASVPVANSVVQPASVATVIPAVKATRIHAAPSTPNLPHSAQDSPVQASRPPLRFVYPVSPDVPTRGVVCLTAQVDSDGAVRTVKVVSGNRALAAAAVRAVRQWRYRPYLKDGQPVPTETNIVVSFISDDAISMTFPSTLPATR